MKKIIARVPEGMEELLNKELISLGAEQTRIKRGGVECMVDEKSMYAILLWSRLASRIYLSLNHFKFTDIEMMYQQIYEIDWSAIFDHTQTFCVYFNGINEAINNSYYGALKVKDAIVDKFMHQQSIRPTVAKQDRDITITIFLQQNYVEVTLDLSGESLHQRGYRKLGTSVTATLKENLAAAIILRSGWKVGIPLLDPMCGSGTLLIEAARMAADYAPGLGRQQWGFNAWKGFNASLWQTLIAEAKTRAAHGINKAEAIFWGADQNQAMIENAKIGAQQAGVEKLIHFNTASIYQLSNPAPSYNSGFILCNLPYGKRLENGAILQGLYHALGRGIKQNFPGWSASILSDSEEVLSYLQLRADRTFKFKNGNLDCLQKNYCISTTLNRSASVEESASINLQIGDYFTNRLAKNQIQRARWAEKEGVDCYRLYDADLPDFNFSIDRYGDAIVLQEYAAPKEIDPQKARQRLLAGLAAILKITGVSENQLIFKTRQAQRGKQQYQKLADSAQQRMVTEYNAKLWVNLTDYIDTGLFLDSRLIRRKIANMSKNGDFLNLFSYTGAATVHAALGGAKSTTSVDLSPTYLAWAQKNLQLNRLVGKQHQFIQADCLYWLKRCRTKFDLILFDPPTFSNSKKMRADFDVQRDYIDMINEIKKNLRANGTLIFCTNRRQFQFNEAAIAQLDLVATEITHETLTEDFKRRRIHRCWLLTHKISSK